MTSHLLPVGTVKEHGARVPRFPPPLYYGAAFAAGMLLRAITPLRIGGRPATEVLGVVVLCAGTAMSLAAIGAVVRHRTTMVPHHPVSTLLTTGIYRLSRNPMYTGLAITYVGVALLAGTWWPLATLPVALLLVRHLVIGPEERYLGEHFGRSYLDYQTRVRRWL